MWDVVCVIIVLYVIQCIHNKQEYVKSNHLFYNVDNICPELKKAITITDNLVDVKYVSLYADSEWNINNCEKYPSTYEFLKSINNLSEATICKYDKNTKTDSQILDNQNLFRCHYSLQNYENFFICVYSDDKQKIKPYKLNEWMIFDSSQHYYVKNDSDIDGILLIVDIKKE